MAECNGVLTGNELITITFSNFIIVIIEDTGWEVIHVVALKSCSHDLLTDKSCRSISIRAICRQQQLKEKGACLEREKTATGTVSQMYAGK